MTQKPTGKQMKDAWQEDDEDFDIIKDEVCEPDDHGHWSELVVKRLSDDTLWRCVYLNQSSGNYIDLRDDPDLIDVQQVWPKEVTVIEYVTTQPQKD